ncbi:MAG: prolyl oligopeptidase family serine peptidase [Candidatus Hydrogenedentes bacterium]|nr:prolyl oligopeptidase family serine peptidase [Candidatus Hydrogenedentota bacterium]
MLNLLLPLVILAAGNAGKIEYETITFNSTHDGTEQPARFYLSPERGPQPLLVLLHSWSTDMYNYNPDSWVAVARSHGWHVAVPHFRGGNFNPEACASAAARQDILDTTTTAISRYAVDKSRIYLAGSSGGGHMAMVMAGHNPETWAAVSAWVGISNLADWHAETKALGLKYFKDVEACVGGSPGSTPQVDQQLRARSPLFHIANAAAIPLDLNAGVHDGHTGSVPIHHTLDAYNAVARELGGRTIDQSVINALSQEILPPVAPTQDPSYGRRIHLRQSAGATRVTIFEGGHEELPQAACTWLAQQRRDGR